MATTPEHPDEGEAVQRVEITLVALLAVGVIWAGGMRLIALPFLALALWNWRPRSNRLAWGVSFAIFVIASYSPYDVRIADISPSHHGTPQAHVGVVPYFGGGMLAHSSVRAKHAEYYNSPGPVIPPRAMISIAFRIDD